MSTALGGLWGTGGRAGGGDDRDDRSEISDMAVEEAGREELAEWVPELCNIC